MSNSSSGGAQSHPHSFGDFNYLDSSAESSLFRNGKVLTHRDSDGSDDGLQGVTLDKHRVAVNNGRALTGSERLTVSANGFELLERPVSGINFLDQEQVLRGYYQHCEGVVKEATGAKGVFAFDHNVRSALGKKNRNRIEGGQEVQGPAHLVHGDYTLTSAPQRLRDLSASPGANDTLRRVLGASEALVSTEAVDRALAPGGRFAIINVWRNIAAEPVATHPLALCDSQTVDPEDLVVFEIHYQDRVGENYFAKHSARHKWHYFPGITPDEALLIKQWDSAGPLASSEGRLGDGSDLEAPCSFSFHSAFEDPASPEDAPDRRSIEVRCIVLYG